MGLGDWTSDHLLATVALALLFGTVAVVSVLGVAGWLLLALLGVGAASTLGSLLPLFVLGVVVGAPGTLLALVGAVVGLTSRASSAVRGERTQRLASYLERESTLARFVGVADLVERFDDRDPEERADQRIDRLKQRYVDGELTEREFERRTRRVLDEEGVGREGALGPDIDRLLDEDRDRSVDRDCSVERA